MSILNRSRKTKSVRMSVRNGDTAKRAGSNRVTIAVQSSDWRIPHQEVSMTIRDAQALRRFLNDTLSD